MNFKNLKKFLASVTLGATFMGFVNCSPAGAMIPAFAACSGLLDTVTINWSYDDLKNAILDYREWLRDNNLPCNHTNHIDQPKTYNEINLRDFIKPRLGTRDQSSDRKPTRYTKIAMILDYCLAYAIYINTYKKLPEVLQNGLKKPKLKGEQYPCIFDCPESELVHCLLGQTDESLDDIMQNLERTKVIYYFCGCNPPC